jgi:hypothetical protein
MPGQNSTPVVLFLMLFLPGVVAAQDSLKTNVPTLRKNTLSLSIIPLFDRTYSFTYSRRLANGNEIFVNPRIRKADPTPSSNADLFGLTKDPKWYYNFYTVRSGLMIRFGKHFAYEPQLEFGYSLFTNKVLKIDDPTGETYDQSVRLDRKYASAGLISMGSWTRDWDKFRMKVFLGVGYQVRHYRETEYELIFYRHSVVNDEPRKYSYYKDAFTFHAGMEIGLRF